MYPGSNNYNNQYPNYPNQQPELTEYLHYRTMDAKSGSCGFFLGPNVVVNHGVFCAAPTDIILGTPRSAAMGATHGARLHSVFDALDGVTHSYDASTDIMLGTPRSAALGATHGARLHSVFDALDGATHFYNASTILILGTPRSAAMGATHGARLHSVFDTLDGVTHSYDGSDSAPDASHRASCQQRNINQIVFIFKYNYLFFLVPPSRLTILYRGTCTNTLGLFPASGGYTYTPAYKMVSEVGWTKTKTMLNMKYLKYSLYIFNSVPGKPFGTRTTLYFEKKIFFLSHEVFFSPQFKNFFLKYNF